jgi:hypothetical protein
VWGALTLSSSIDGVAACGISWGLHGGIYNTTSGSWPTLDLVGHGDKVNETAVVTPNAKALFEKSFASYSLV